MLFPSTSGYRSGRQIPTSSLKSQIQQLNIATSRGHHSIFNNRRGWCYTAAFLIALVLFLIPAQIMAAQVTLEWDPNDPAPQGYRLYQRVEGQTYNNYSQPIWSGQQTTHTVTDLDDSTTYYFVVHAYVGSDESGDSNEASFRYDPPTPQTYTITATSGINGTITPSGRISLASGSNRTFSFTADSGFHVEQVFVDGQSIGATQSYTFTNVTDDHTIAVSFAADGGGPAPVPGNHTIYAFAGQGGSITPQGSVSVADGGSQTFSIVPNFGYDILDLRVDGTSLGEPMNSYTFQNITVDHTIEVLFVAPNQLPVADAGPNQIVVSLSSVTLNGSGSRDPAGQQISCRWVQKSGMHVTLSNPYAVQPFFTAPEVEGQDVFLTFELTVTDSDNLSSSDTCVVQVKPVQSVDQPMDTDGDGLPDETDPDDDNDGMPDTWESQYGLNPLLADADQDPDQDNMTNIEEYQAGTNPLEAEGNSPPSQPVLSVVPQYWMATLASLTPTLTASDFNDPDADDQHLQTQWQIMESNSQKIVLDIICENNNLTNLTVPYLVLTPATEYKAKVRFFDNHGQSSDWSLLISFTTESDNNDNDKNGIPDLQEVAADVDLNADGVSDADQGHILKSVNTYNDQYKMAVSIPTDDTSTEIVCLTNVDPSTLESGPYNSTDMPYGLMAYRIIVEQPGQTQRVKLHFSDPIDPQQAQWVRYDRIKGWTICSAQALASADGYTVELELVDGGDGDADGVANGLIIHQSGPLFTSANDGSGLSLSDGGPSSSEESSACFIQSLF